MLPEKTTPSSRRNTLHNIGVIEEPSNPLPMGPVFISFDPPQLGGWSPDDEENFYHIIRDQPYDDGTETSPQLEPPAINFGTHSDVWNSDKPPHPGQNKNNEYDDGTPMFGPDHSPTHTPPLNVGRNHMCVRLHTCEPLTGPVNVYFYLAAPFTGNLSPLLEGDNGPHLVFDIGGPFPLAPQPGEPTTKSVEWTVPNGYSPNSSIFAVATSAQEGMPPQDIQDVIYNPTAFSSSKLEPVQSDNDVAWRGDFIQLTTTVSSSSSANAMSSSNRSTDAGAFSSMLPWLQIANPSEAAAAAHMEIDTSLAPNLAGLSLELDEKPLGEVNIGGPVTVNLAGALQPDERMTLRLHALLPLAAPEGTTYPINLRFFVDNQLIGGYQYVLRVAPLSEAVVQVLDHLFGALRDVAAGFETDAAQDLAGNVREIILREKGIEARRGFWGLVQRVFSPKPGDWQTELGSLASRVAALAQSLEVATSIEPECQVMCQHLYELAGRLLTIADTESPNLFIEQVRDVVDHIQEPAGRLARRL
jgi:hypothetical protein